MPRTMHRAGWALPMALATTLMHGCTGAKQEPSTPSKAPKLADGQVIIVACPGDPATAVVTRYSALWAVQTGANVDVKRYGREDGPEAVADADIWVLEPAELPHWAAADRLEPVPAEYRGPTAPYAWRNLLAPMRDRLLEWDGKTYGMPVLGGTLLCYYRQDLLSDARAQGDFKRKTGQTLGPPATWDEFAQIANFFRERTGTPSLPPLPTADDDLDAEYYAVAAPLARQGLGKEAARLTGNEFFSFHYDLVTGRPRIGAAAFVEALRLLAQLQSCRPPGTGRPGETFRQGRAVLCVADAAWAGRFQERDSRVRGRFGICEVPASTRVFAFTNGRLQHLAQPNRVPYLGSGGWVGVVRRGSPRAEAAFAMLAALGGPETSKEVMLEPAWGADVWRREQVDNRSGWESLELGAALTNTLVETLRATQESPLLNPVYRLRIPDQRPHQRALVEEVRKALSRPGMDTEQVMAAVAGHWEQFDAHQPQQQRLRDYRLSLGLRGD